MVRIDYDISDDSYYLFTSAELRTREREFLDKNRIERMVRSAKLDEFFKVLRDTVYSGYINDLENPGNFDKVLIEEYGKIIKFLSERLKPDDMAAVEILFLEENLHNLKTVIKSVILDRELESFFIPILDSYQTLRGAALTGNYKEVREVVAEVLRFAVGLIGQQKNYRFMELELENFYLKKMFDSAKKIDRRLIIDYFRHIIDIYNIKNICRNKYLAEDFDFDSFIYENGFLTRKYLLEFRNESLDFFAREMERTDYSDIVTKGINALHSGRTFSAFEKNEDLFRIDFFEPVKFTVSNLERIFQFFLIKKLELKYLNIIHTGIIYGIEKNKIEEKVKI